LGYSFTYPDDWIVEDPVTILDQSNLPPAIQEWNRKNNMILKKVSMILIRNGKEEFLENLNVTVSEGQMPMNNDAANKALDVVREQFRSMGATFNKSSGHVGQLGANNVVILEYQATFPGLDVPLKLRQVCFAGGGKTFVVTCTAREDTFDAHSQTFDKIVASFKVPNTSSAPFQMMFDFPGAVFGGLAVGAIVVFVWLIAKMVAYPFRRQSLSPKNNTQSPYENQHEAWEDDIDERRE
jgi:hypothetical protein